jgi:hypothetical protein
VESMLALVGMRCIVIIIFIATFISYFNCCVLKKLLLWYSQKQDLKCVVSFLRNNKQVSCIGLWGRSMGAVTRYLSTVLVFYFV